MKNLSNGVVLNYFFGEYIIYSTDQKSWNMMVKLKKKVNELLCATHSIIKYTFDVVFFDKF